MDSEDQHNDVIELLKSIGQDHILAALPPKGSNNQEKNTLFEQVRQLNASFPGGLAQYVANAKALLISSKEGRNPYEGYSPAVPQGQRLSPGNSDFVEAEAIGTKELKGACFVIVAGGLGERLGYNGIKLELPSEITTERSFLHLYCLSVLALQDRVQQETNQNIQLPLCIMTSGDTHEKTIELLENNNYFNMKDQITIVKQEKVPALTDNDAHFAMDDTFTISTKPHGHGDIHTLLHSKNVVSKWLSEGRKWVCFLQDTNGLVFRAIPAAIGVSAKNQFAVNSLAVPRKPGEAVGGICKLVHSDGSNITINVEYNQLDPLLKATGKGGDTADETGFSPFPGNINVLIFELGSYVKTLQRTNGMVPEFVNPKYADSTNTNFKKPTRLECMMQDYPKLLSSEDKVGFTQIDRWLSFSAVKNNVVDAADKHLKTGAAESASSGEADMYYVCRRVLADAGVKVTKEGPLVSYANIPTVSGAHVVLSPSFGVTVSEIQSRFPSPAEVSISDRSTLIVDGDVVFEGLELDGALVIRAEKGTKVVVKGLKVRNAGWEFEPVNQTDKLEEKYLIRGYKLKKNATAEYHFHTAGSHVLSSL
eukprot:c11458_g1_i1.p1 GENE.c11458_g1_i1~~c11458_g1_i1.p1  ORF type:complete len:593 (+),score=248.73 c11458_g1_i1:805-2583(+)